MSVINLKEATRSKDAKQTLSKLKVDFERDDKDFIHCYWKNIAFQWGSRDPDITVFLEDMPVIIPIPQELEPNSDNVKLLIACFLNRLY